MRVGFDYGVVLVHIPTVTWPFHGKFGTTLEIQKKKGPIKYSRQGQILGACHTRHHLQPKLKNKGWNFPSFELWSPPPPPPSTNLPQILTIRQPPRFILSSIKSLKINPQNPPFFFVKGFWSFTPCCVFFAWNSVSNTVSCLKKLSFLVLGFFEDE